MPPPNCISLLSPLAVCAFCAAAATRVQMLTLARPHRAEVPDGQAEEKARELAQALLRHPALRVSRVGRPACCRG